MKNSFKEILPLKNILNKCKLLSKKSKQKISLAEENENRGWSFPKPTNTRWNSEIKLLRSVIKVNMDELNNVLRSCDILINFSSNDFTIINDLLEILSPFEYLTDNLQAENFCTISSVAPSVFELLVHLEDVKSNSSWLQNFIKELDLNVRKRFNGLIENLKSPQNDHLKENYGDYCFFISSFLDPLFKFYWLQFLVECNFIKHEAKDTFECKFKRIIIKLAYDLNFKSTSSTSNQSNFDSEFLIPSTR